MTVTPVSQAKSELSEQIWEATQEAHQRAQASDFMLRLLNGSLSRDHYAAFMEQLALVYDVLEAGGRRMVAEPAARPFISPALERGPSLHHDLQVLRGYEPDPVAPTGATRAYCDRIRALSDPMVGPWWPAGYVAHHYVRYLGDLSGGQFIGTVIANTFGSEAATFYVFDAIADLDAFKANYRKTLNEAWWTDEERELFIAEILRAYELNDALVASVEC